MTEDSNFVFYKPSMACLFTHFVVWNFLGIGNSGRDVYECSRCKNKFYYPTKKDDPPVYKK